MIRREPKVTARDSSASPLILPELRAGPLRAGRPRARVRASSRAARPRRRSPPPPRGRRAGARPLDGVGHRRAVGQVVRVAVEHDRVTRCARSSGSNGRLRQLAVGDQARNRASAVSGASRTPLRWWPVAHTRPSHAGADRGRVVGRPRAQAGARAHELQLADVGQDLAGRLEQPVDGVGRNGGVEALLLLVAPITTSRRRG